MNGDNYLAGTIVAWPGPVVPRDWLPCDGRAMQVSQNSSLFSLLGFHFGGNGTTTFNLPDLRGMAVGGAHLGGGSAPDFGTAGMEPVQLTVRELPAHGHALAAVSAQGNATGITNAVPASVGTSPHVTNRPPVYAAPDNLAQLDPASVGNSGGNPAPHSNMQPYCALQFIICTVGLYPTHN